MAFDLYVAQMQVATMDVKTWGGFVEASLLSHKENLACALFEHTREGHRLLSILNPGAASGTHGILCITWSGAHWNVVRLSEAPMAKLMQKVKQALTN